MPAVRCGQRAHPETDAYLQCRNSQLLSLRDEFGRDLRRLSNAERRTIDSACSGLRISRGRTRTWNASRRDSPACAVVEAGRGRTRHPPCLGTGQSTGGCGCGRAPASGRASVGLVGGVDWRASSLCSSPPAAAPHSSPRKLDARSAPVAHAASSCPSAETSARNAGTRRPRRFGAPRRHASSRRGRRKRNSGDRRPRARTNNASGRRVMRRRAGGRPKRRGSNARDWSRRPSASATRMHNNSARPTPPRPRASSIPWRARRATRCQRRRHRGGVPGGAREVRPGSGG